MAAIIKSRNKQKNMKVEEAQVRDKLFEEIRSKTKLASLRCCEVCLQDEDSEQIVSQRVELSVFGRKPKPRWCPQRDSNPCLSLERAAS